MQEKITDPFTDALRYILQYIDYDALFLKNRPPFNIKVPESYASFNNAANPLEVKHLSISELSNFAESLQEHQAESVLEQAQVRLNRQIEEHFKGILDKRGISEQDWHNYGYRKMNNYGCEYYYKSKMIFRISYHKVNIEPSSTEGTYSVYYEEIQ